MSLPGLLAHSGEPHDLPALGPLQLVTEARVEPLLAVGLVVVAVAYLSGVRRLRARGDAWPVGRSVSFLGLGLGSVVLATMSGLAAYDEVLFSAHMVQHMVLSMVSPVFLALGAPVTLALRTVPTGLRRWLLAVLHSRVARVVGNPLVGWLAFVGTPFALYFSGWYPATLDSGVLHAAMHVHFLLVGCLYFFPLLGLDPVPGRLPYPLRLLVVFAALPFHAFLGIAIMSMTDLIAAEHYLGVVRDWGTTPLADQRTGGGLLWASGDLVGLLFLGVLITQWMRASEREAVREDRRLDRLDEAAALEARNAAASR